METKFTKGPWRIEERTVGNRLMMVRAGFGNICLMSGNVDKLANAHLITSAPDLYEALVYAQVALADMTLDSPAIRHALPLVRAALAKARGGQL